MILNVDKKYLLLPVSSGAVKKVLTFYHEQKLVYELTARIDLLTPEYFYPVDMHIFIGLKLEVFCKPEIKLKLEMSNNKPELPEPAERYRPIFHFTVKYGWINDPNGLVQIGNKYHMFYQYNPAGSEWGNMHWGHSSSSDLFHWEEHETTLYPDEMGTMYSGSAIIDRENRSGLSINGEPVTFLFYTAAGNTSGHSKDVSRTQCAAYSTDGGITFKKYEHNPVVPHIKANNRDPKVVFAPELNKFIMALYLVDHQYCLLTSDNLLKWEKLQDITLPDDTECPDFYPIAVDGDADNTKWVLSGAADYYLVGKFENGHYVVEQEQKRLCYGKTSYAGQTFSDVRDGRRLKIAWDRLKVPDSPFNSQMGVPCEVSLIEEDNQYFLCAQPVYEIKSLYQGTYAETGLLIAPDKPFKMNLNEKAYDISLMISDVSSEDFTLTLFGQTVVYNAEANQVIFMDNMIPAKIGKGPLNMRLIVDKLSVEIFNDKGRVSICNSCISDYNLNTLEISCSKELKIDNITVSGIFLKNKCE